MSKISGTNSGVIFAGCILKTDSFIVVTIFLQPDFNNRHSTPLHYAAGFGRAECVRTLLAAGGDSAQADDGGLVPLHNAASFGHFDVVKILLENGADPNVSDHWGFTPLHEAAAWGKVCFCFLFLIVTHKTYYTRTVSKSVMAALALSQCSFTSKFLAMKKVYIGLVLTSYSGPRIPVITSSISVFVLFFSLIVFC